MSSTIIKMSHCSFLDFHITFSPLPWESIEAQDHQRCCGYFLFNSYFLLLLEFEVSQVKRRVFWRDVLKLRQVTNLPFYLTGLHNKSFIESGSEAVVQRCSVSKDVFRNFAKLTGKHLCQSLFLIKLQVSRPATLSNKRLWHRCFQWILWNFLEQAASVGLRWK